MTLIDKAEALAPCPFCGGEAELWNAHDNRPAWIACMGRCAVLISKEHATDAEAIAAWNRRAAIPARGVPTDCRKWDCYPIEMPLTKDGHGPAIPGRDEIARITYEVWDRTLETHASFDNLPDAINEAMRLSLAALAPTDAAQAREAALAMLDLHDGFLAGKDVDLAAANRLHLAASFGAQAFAVCPEPDARPSAMLRAFLLAMIDPMHPDLDYLRAKNVARVISEART